MYFLTEERRRDKVRERELLCVCMYERERGREREGDGLYVARKERNMRKREWKAAAGDMMKEMRVVVSVVVVVVVVLLGGGIDMARAEVVEADVGAYSCPGEGEYVFRTWTERIADASGRSVQFPKDDAALAALLKLAEEEGRHVRVTGASHSINGIVMNSGDNAMVVSLACYEPPADSGWRLALDTDTGYVSAPAGYSLLVRLYAHMYTLTPPRVTSSMHTALWLPVSLFFFALQFVVNVAVYR